MEARNLKAIEKKNQPEIKKSKLSNDIKVEIAGRVSRIVGIMQNISTWLPFPLFTKTWRDYPEIFTEYMVDDLKSRSLAAGVESPTEFLEAALLGIKYGLLEKDYCDFTIGGIGCDILIVPADYCDRVVVFVTGRKHDKILPIAITNKQQRERFQTGFNFK